MDLEQEARRWLARVTGSSVDGPLFPSMEVARRVFAAILPSCCEVCRFEPPIHSSWRNDYSQFDLHHIVPRATGGTIHFGNLVMLCANCHRMADSIAYDPGFLRHRSEFLEEFRLAYRDPAAFVRRAEGRHQSLTTQ